MKTKLKLAARLVLGAILLVFGLNNFLQFISQPPPSEQLMQAFGNLIALGFIMPTVAIVQITVGIALLSNRFKSLALVILVPITYSMIAFHLAFDVQGIVFASVVAILNIILLFSEKDKFSAVLASK